MINNMADRDLSLTRQATYLFSAFFLIGILLRSKIMLTQERLKELLSYDSKSGAFTRRVCVKGSKGQGAFAGSNGSKGYLSVSVDRTKYLIHRLAWLYMYGYFPEHQVDHIDRDKLNNRISNLREASSQCNLRNTGNRKNNISGIKGVSFCKSENKWRAQITVNKKNHNVGRYKSFDNAVCARLAAEQCLNWSGCDSNSPAYKYVKKMLQENRENG